MGADDGDITAIVLLKEGTVTPVAFSKHGDTLVGLGGRSRSHTLFYKETVGADAKFTVAWDAKPITAASAGVVPSIEAKNLQWGYKTYAASYMLETAPAATC